MSKAVTAEAITGAAQIEGKGRRGPVKKLPRGGTYQREVGKGDYGWVKCQECGTETYMRIPYGKGIRVLTGRCEDCRRAARLRVIELPGGGSARRDPDNPHYGWVVCPYCKKEEYRSIPQGSKGLLKFTGGCRECKHLRQRTHTGVVTHRSGAKLLLDDRDPAAPGLRAAFICADFGKVPGCLGKTFGYLYRFDMPDFTGRCEHCRPLWLRKYRGIVILDDGPGGAPGTQFLLDDEDDQGLILLKYRLCSHDRRITRQLAASYIGSYQERGQKPPARCRPCFLDSTSQLESALLQAQPRNGDAQKNGGGEENGAAKKRQRGARTVINDVDAFKAIAALAPDVDFSKLSRALGHSRATVRTWAGKKGCKEPADLLKINEYQEWTQGGGNKSI